MVHKSGQIKHLMLYPVKSAAGIDVSAATLTRQGLLVDGYADHQFVIVRAQADVDGYHTFVTQRDMRERDDVSQGFSAISLIKPRMTAEVLELTWEYQEPVSIPFLDNDNFKMAVTVWNHRSHGFDQGDEVARWLTDHLGTRVRLVRAPDSFGRPAKQNVVENDNTLLFQDGYPIHWFSITSIDELSVIAGNPVQWETFRPQIVVDGLPPRYEHQIGRGHIAGIPFVNAKPCDRCQTTNVDQKTGVVQIGRVLKPLSTYKKWRDDQGALKVIFGENMLPLGDGPIAIGDEVTVEALRDPPLVYGRHA